MADLKIILDGDKCWPDLEDRLKTKDEKLINAMGEQTRLAVAALPGGMSSGKTSVTFRVDTPDGRTVLFETSLALLKMAVDAIVVRYRE